MTKSIMTASENSKPTPEHIATRRRTNVNCFTSDAFILCRDWIYEIRARAGFVPLPGSPRKPPKRTLGTNDPRVVTARDAHGGEGMKSVVAYSGLLPTPDISLQRTDAMCHERKSPGYSITSRASRLK